jgi:hypothetical protein
MMMALVERMDDPFSKDRPVWLARPGDGRRMSAQKKSLTREGQAKLRVVARFSRDQQ